MPSRIDLTKFWQEHPEYVGRPKRYAIYGQRGAIGANSVNTPVVVETEKGTDFIATAIATVPVVAAAAAYDPNPFLGQVQWPSGRLLLSPSLSTGAQQRFEFLTFSSTGFKVFWDWPWPVIIRGGGNVITTWDNTHAGAVVMNVAFHGIRVTL